MAFGTPSLKGRALRLLAQREHSRTELARKLQRSAQRAAAQAAARNAAQGTTHSEGSAAASSHDEGTDAPGADSRAAIETALDELAAHGLQSDERAASSVLHTLAGRYGERRLRQTLQAKGLDDELVARTLQQARASEHEHARAVWQRKFGQPPRDAAERARQLRFLLGRGFSAELAARVLRDAGAAAPDDDDGLSV